MNTDITISCIMNGVRKKDIAEKLGITDSSFSRKLRKELRPDEKENILRIIESLKK